MRSSASIILCVLLALIAGMSFATEVTIFGPEQYVRTSGAPDVFNDSFTATPGDGRLIVSNGNQSGDDRIFDSLSSAQVFLNGEEIFGKSDFNQQVYLLEASVTLVEDNSLSVELASNPGSYLTVEVVQEGEPSPTVTITADPMTIQVGESSTLTWSSDYADTCEIDQGIGRVDLSGSITVSPTETTTYTITATGFGGTVTNSTTVNVGYPEPTVSISADPETINIGESTVLTWSSTYVDSASIDNGIGDVDTDGSITVSPTETTTYTITGTGSGGTATADVTVTLIHITLTITSPTDGDTIFRPDTIVQGTMTNSTGTETGVTVNGVLAVLDGDQFTASHVPLEEGENTITATAVDMEGNTVSDSVTVYVDTTGDYVRLSADTESGVAPFETTLEVETTFPFSTEPVLSYTGPGVVEILDGTNENEYNVIITTPGVYTFTVEVTDDQSNIYTDTIVIEVLDLAQLDALLTAKWGGAKSKLVAGDVEDALEYIHDASRDKYESIYNFLGDALPALAAQMQNIELIFAEGNRAKYRISRDHDIDGQIVTITYYIYFNKDGNGLWKIESY